MKKVLVLLVGVACLFLASCDEEMSYCVEEMEKDGYSYEEAVKACEDARAFRDEGKMPSD